MNYTLWRESDRLPTVGVLQKPLTRTGARLTPDCAYGPQTKAAVQKFQRERTLSPDGAVGENTWPRVSAGANLPVVDCIDVFGPSLQQLEASDIRRAGGNPIVIGGMRNGVEQAVPEIVNSAHSVFLLRFHGHRARGAAGISSGHGELDPDMIHRADIALENLREIRQVLGRLRGVCGPWGCVQFMHCETGGGPSGRRMLSGIAEILGVPVSAGIHTQYGGGAKTFRFEGPTHTAIAGAGSLAGWFGLIPDFPNFTPA